MAVFNILSYPVTRASLDNAVDPLLGGLGFVINAMDNELLFVAEGAGGDGLLASGDGAARSENGEDLGDPNGVFEAFETPIRFLRLTDASDETSVFTVAALEPANNPFSYLVLLDLEAGRTSSGLPLGTDFEVALIDAPAGDILYVNQEIEAVEDSAATTENATVGIAVLDNDVDLGLDLTVTEAAADGGGSFTTDGTTVTFDPGTDFDSLSAGVEGTATGTYTVSTDPENAGAPTATGSISVTITGENDPVTANDDTVAVDEDVPTALAVAANDDDPDADDTLTVISIDSEPTNGTAVIRDGDIVYTTDRDSTASDTLTYTVSDGTTTSQATVTITVDAVNDDPTVEAALEATFSEDDAPAAIDLLSGATDVEGDMLSVDPESFTGISGVTLDGDTADVDPGAFNALAAGETGGGTVGYTIIDGNGGTVAQTLTITINGVNDQPTAADDSLGAGAGLNQLDVLANDDDPDATDVLTVTEATGASNGTVAPGPDGLSVAYTPNDAFQGEDTFTYTVSDGNGGTDTATVTVTVSLEPEAPVANDDSAETDQDTSVLIDVLENDTDVNAGDVLDIVAVGEPAAGTAVVEEGQIRFDPGGDLDSLPGGESRDITFAYTVSDGVGETEDATATVTVTVAGLNDEPGAADDVVALADAVTPVSIDVLANDADVDDGDVLTIVEVGMPAAGTATITGEGTGIAYTPGAAFEGTDSFVYEISDGNGGQGFATVTVSLGPVAPVAGDDTATTDEDTLVTIDVLANDSDGNADDVLSVVAVGTPGAGAVAIEEGQVVFDPTGAFDALAAGATTTETFTYTISDGVEGTEDATATVTVTIAGVNDAPVAADDSATTGEEEAVAIDVLANDSDVDGEVFIESFGEAGNGTVAEGEDGLVYTPAPGFSGTDSFIYTVSDGTETATATVTVDVEEDAPPQPPEPTGLDAVDDSVVGSLLGSVTGNVLANDLSTDAAPQVTAVEGMEDAVGNRITLDSGATLSLGVAGGFTYSAAGAIEDPTVVDSFTYTIFDGTQTDTATVTITFPNAVAGGDEDDSFTVETFDVAQTFLGGGGTDSVDFPGNIGDVTIEPIASSFRITPAEGEPVEVSEVERLSFDDDTATLRADATSTTVELLYAVALGRFSDVFGMGFWTGRADEGLSFGQIADAFAAAGELDGDTLTNGDFVRAVYRNGLDRDADEAGEAFWTGLLDSGAADRGDILLAFTESAEVREVNEIAIDDGSFLV